MPKEKKVDWFSIANELHLKYKGKIEVVPKVPVTKLKAFAIWYTPGVAGPCRKIFQEGKDLSFEYTVRWNYALVISDGTRVLGLGNIGPEAGMPVMEGKALLFKYLGGVDAIPLVVNEHDPDKFMYIVKALEPSFGAVNLEDIESPKCFYILEKLNEILDIPVWHDDQQGTALVTLAGLINALKIVGKKLHEAKITLVGAGAANIATYKYLKIAGADPRKMLVVDSKGILHQHRKDMETLRKHNPWKYRIALETNPEGKTGGIKEALEGADVVIAASRPGPGVIRKEWIKAMANDPIVFAEANPVPEIWPWEAKEAGARIIATGRSDFPNQINNSLGFPAVFRGILTVRSRKMTDSMFIAAAEALVKYAEQKGIHEEYIIPAMEEAEAYVMEAIAVAEKAMEEGVARRKISRSELEQEVRELIMRPRKYMEVALREGLITIESPYPVD
ncbi:malate dehydrogenase [Candidatus Woesearchaeota archaeon]|nr:MAG: malate dehydrogenase [Candidatus Woesearchaeota archaeon]